MTATSEFEQMSGLRKSFPGSVLRPCNLALIDLPAFHVEHGKA